MACGHQIFNGSPCLGPIKTRSLLLELADLGFRVLGLALGGFENLLESDVGLLSGFGGLRPPNIQWVSLFGAN